MADTLQFDPQERHNFNEWMKSDDVTPQGLFQALGVSPGAGKYRSREDLDPTFLDKFLDRFGIQTDRTKELKELSSKQKALLPFAQQLLQVKVADQVHRNAMLRAAPQTADEAPQLAGMFGGAPAGLQPAPAMSDAAMAGMPLGASSANAAAMPQIGPPDTADTQPLAAGGRFMQPDAMNYAALPTAPPSAGVPGSPNPMQYGSNFDEQGRPLPMQPAPALPEQPIRPEPIAAPMARAPQPAQAPRQLKEWERLQAASALHSEATGSLVRDDQGRLVPASFMSADSKLLTAPQQAELASIYNGSDPTGRVPLPQTSYMKALAGKQDKTLKGLSQPIQDYLQAKGLQPTAANIDKARTSVETEKQTAEAAQIRLKESLQAGAQDIKTFLAAKTGKTNLVDATPDEIEQAIKDKSDNELDIHDRKAAASFNLSGLDGGEKEKLTGLQQIARVTERLKNEFSPAERKKYVGYFNLPLTRVAQLVNDDPKFAKFDALVNREGIAAFETGGKALTAQEAAIIFGFLPSAKEFSPINFEAKLLEADDYSRSKIKDIVTIATTNRRDMARQMAKDLPAKGPKPSAAERYNQLSKQSMKEDEIYRQLSVEGYKP